MVSADTSQLFMGHTAHTTVADTEVGGIEGRERQQGHKISEYKMRESEKREVMC